MRKLGNVEIAKYVFKKLEEKYDADYEKILAMVDDSINYDNDIEKDEDGEIKNLMSEEEIIDLKNRMFSGIEEYYDNIKD